MVKNFNIKKLNIKFVFRHYWEERGESAYLSRYPFKTKEFGIFFRKDLCVGYAKSGATDIFSEKNHRPSYMFGIQLGWIKAWMTIDYGVIHFNTDKTNAHENKNS